ALAYPFAGLMPNQMRFTKGVPMMGLAKNSIRIFLACGFACVTAWPQAVSTSQINGTVHDSSGAAVPGAEVRAIQTSTGLVRSIPTASDGGYVLTSLPI